MLKFKCLRHVFFASADNETFLVS